LRIFFDFLGIEGNLDERAKLFVILSEEENMALIQDRIKEFILYEVQRSRRGEVSLSTIPDYIKALKPFCEMNEIEVGWKEICRGIPLGRQAANDRAPTREEILKLIRYADRRINPIVYVMASPGIRL
jgi:hypothetical protein